MIPLVGFLPADDPRVRGTVAAIETRPDARRLRRPLRHRRRRSTACRPARGPSCPARSGWPTTCALLGRHDEARAIFERLLGLRNDVGLLSEEYDPHGAAAGRQLPAGVLSRRPGQHGAEPVAGRRHPRVRSCANKAQGPDSCGRGGLRRRRAARRPEAMELFSGMKRQRGQRTRTGQGFP